VRGLKRRKPTVIIRSLLLMTLVTSVAAAALFTPIASGIKDGEAADRTDSVGTCNMRAGAPPATKQPPALKWFMEVHVDGSCAVVTDLDGDNKPEIIVNSEEVYCLTGTGGIKWIGQVMSDGHSTPTVADVDGDGRQEILVSGTYSDNQLYCLNWTGGLKWTSAQGIRTGYWFSESSPTVADIDQDGKKEILVGSELYLSGGNVTHPGYLACFNASGALKWTYLANESVYCRPAVADLEGSDKIDVLFGSGSGEIYCLNSTGERVWNYSTGAGVIASPVVVDVDGDGENEVLCSSGDNLYCLNSLGMLKWMYNATTFCLLSSNVTDVDNDGKLEIVLGTSGHEVICVGGTGERKWSYATESAVGGPPVVSDVDGDNQLEIIAGTTLTLVGGSLKNGGVVYCLDGLGNLKWTYATGSYIYATPTVADVDGDGRPEIIISGAFQGLYCLSAFPSPRLGLLSLPLIGVGLVVAIMVAVALRARKPRDASGLRAVRHWQTRTRSHGEVGAKKRESTWRL
jgi:hypothetical protein